MNVGKVRNYDGITGEIVTEKETYYFSYYGIAKEVKNGDLVSFTIVDKDDNLAVDVRPYVKVDLKSLMKVIDEN